MKFVLYADSMGMPASGIPSLQFEFFMERSEKMNKFSRERVKGFLQTDGRRMVNEDGKTVILRGYGVGNWMNPEGFMIGGVPLFTEVGSFTDFALPRRFERGRTMETTVRELCGTAYAKEFSRRWYSEYLSEKDFALMAKLGYNSVRLPVSARLFLAEEPEIKWIEEGFQVLEQVLEWCEKYRIYAILDLHGAPGGQSGLACDDGLDNRPHMFTEPESRERAMLLWEELARRYHDKWIIGGYDLLNEPLSGPDCRKYLPELIKFYDELITRIRKYDQKHMLTLEGSVFAMDMDIFDHDYDPEYHNWCIHIHYYGFSPEARSLYRFLDSGIRCNVPIWIGEGGSNPQANSIFYEIAASFDIGYSIWSWKRAYDPNGTAPVQYLLPKEWSVVQNYIRNGGPRPSYAEAKQIMDEMLENMEMEHCKIDYETSRYNLRQSGIEIPAVGFDEGSAKGTGWIYGNVYGYRTEAGMKMPLRPGVKPPQREVVPTGEPLREADPLKDLCLELREGESVSYTIRDVADECTVKVHARGNSESQMSIICKNQSGKKLSNELSKLCEDTTIYSVIHLTAEEQWNVTLMGVAGSVQIDSIIFE